MKTHNHTESHGHSDAHNADGHRQTKHAQATPRHNKTKKTNGHDAHHHKKSASSKSKH